MNDVSLERLCEELADDREVDWGALEGLADSDAARAVLENLRVLFNLRDACRHSANEASTSQELDQAPAAPGPVPVPSRWGRYELIRHVGGGSYGDVYLARDPDLWFDVALKILRGGTQPDLRQRLLLEGRVLAKIRHPNVVDVLTVEAHDDRLALCMRFVEGETLEAVVQRHTMDARQAALVGEDVCSALAVVHKADIIHRDVKARNVMRARDGRIVLMDFGAGELLTGTGRSTPQGTPLYMAPELFTGVPASRSSDTYSVGVLLYYLVTGSYPVTAATTAELMTAHATGRRRLLHDARSDLPLAFRQLVERAIAPDPDRRFPTAGAMLEALEQLRTGTTEPTATRFLLKPLRSVLVAAGVLAGLGILGSRYFNFALGRDGFVNESWWDWIVFGARASVLPATLLALGLIAAAVPVALCRIVAASGLGRTPGVARVRQACSSLCDGLGLRDTAVATSYVLLLSAAILVGTLFTFSPLLTALFSYMPDTDAARLAWLSTDHCGTHEAYQAILIAGAWLSAGGWFQVIRVAKRRPQPVNRWMLSGGVAIVSLMVALLYFPYRMLNHNDFKTARWENHECYLTGARGSEMLLFCPDLATQRNRIVKASEVTLTGPTESLFWRFASSPQARKRCDE